MTNKKTSDIGFLKKTGALAALAVANFFKATSKIAPYALLAAKPIAMLTKNRSITKNPMFLFLKMLIGKWVLVITIAGLFVAYSVFQSLSQAGILSKFERTLTDAIRETKSVAIYCVPQILNLGDFWDCLQSPPRYIPSHYDRQLQEELSKKSNSYFIPDSDAKDPYDE